jgi:hypothetical protein
VQLENKSNQQLENQQGQNGHGSVRGAITARRIFDTVVSGEQSLCSSLE